MFNTLNIEAIISTVRIGSYIQDTFLKKLKLSEFRIDLSRFYYSITTEGKKVFEEILFKMKMGYISRQSCVMRNGLKR